MWYPLYICTNYLYHLYFIALGGFLHQDTFKARMKAKLPIDTHRYSVCPSGCLLYQVDETTECCPFCKKSRTKADNSTPAAEMQMFSVGDQLARLLAIDDYREKVRYTEEFVHEEGVYKDYFSGSAFRDLVRRGVVDTSKDLCIGFEIDGFRSSQRNGSNLTIVNLINFSLPPEERYVSIYLCERGSKTEIKNTRN
jgi:hypothetical protein